ncbi:SpoIIE family protein phosphatase [Acidothermaceae bacterium B102]|nr:SpoIIE family protein phosphatase [Acidothermaceae bacterium B102]
MTASAALAALVPLDDDAELLYDRAPCGYLSTTPDGMIIKVNQTFLGLVGLRREDLVGRRSFGQLLTVGSAIFHQTHVSPLLRVHGAATGVALDLVRDDGSRLPVTLSSVLERDDSGTAVVIRSAVFDDTERRSYERELVRAGREAEQARATATALAQTLQLTLIPPAPPTIEGLEVAAAYRPARAGDEVGGDFYDFFETVTGDWVLAVGDVCGKGVDAAVVTALLRHSLRSVALRPHLLAEALSKANTELLQHGDRFATVALLWLRPAAVGWDATLSLGGHPQPLLTRNGTPPEPYGDAGSLVGAVDAASFSETTFTLFPGDSLLLFTDGVTEGRRGREFYGDDRLVEAVTGAARSAETIVTAVLADVMAFQDGDPRDDIALLAVRVP